MWRILVFSLCLTIVLANRVRHTSLEGVTYIMDENLKLGLFDARAACRPHGAILAAPRNQSEIDFILSKFKQEFVMLDGLAANRNSQYYYEDGSEALAYILDWMTRDHCLGNLQCGISIHNINRFVGASYEFISYPATSPQLFACQIVKGGPPPVRIATTPPTDPHVIPTSTLVDDLLARIEVLEQEREQLQIINSKLLDSSSNANDTDTHNLKSRITELENLNQILTNRTEEVPILSDLHDHEIPGGFINSMKFQIGGIATRMGFRVSFMKNSSDDLIAFQC